MTEGQAGGAGDSGGKQYDAFISHATADKAEADRVVEALESRGLKCWIAPRDMRPGVEYGAEIIEGIRQSKTLVVLLSKVSVTSRHVRAEVERAVTFNHTVYPVRLEDVELGEALEFFLSIRQWIDVFDDPMEANLKRLADAISSNAAPETITAQTRRPPWMRWAIPSAVAGVTLFALLAIYEWVSVSLMTRQATKQLEQAMAGVNAAAPTPAKAAKDLDADSFTYTFSGYGDTPTLNISANSNQTYLLNQLDMQLSIAGGPYESVERFQRLPISKFEKIKIRYVDEDGKTVYDDDVTKPVIKAAADYFRQQNRSTNSQLKCSLSTCSFGTPSNSGLCASAITDAEFGKGEKPKKWHKLDRSACAEKPANSNVSFCRDYTTLPFSIEPAEPVTMRLTLIDGSHYELALPVDASRLMYSMRGLITPQTAANFDNQQYTSNWVEMTPLDKPTEGVAPNVLLGFQGEGRYEHGLTLHAAVETCAQNFRNEIRHDGWLIDYDGKGLTRQNNGFSFAPKNSANQNERAAFFQDLMSGPIELSIALDMKDGRRIGPYRYRGDPQKALELAVARNQPAELACGPTRSYPSEWACLPKENIAWIGKRTVRFGPSSDNLNTARTVEYSVNDYLSNNCAIQTRNECWAIRFTPPEEWGDVYYQIEQPDGSLTAIERVIKQ